MPKEGVARPEPSPFYTKPTFSVLSTLITEAAVSFGNGKCVGYDQADNLKEQLFLSPRLTQWHKHDNGYRIYNSDQTAYVHVNEAEAVVSNRKKSDDIIRGLPAATLFQAIQDAQAIVQSAVDDTPDEEFFDEEETFHPSAGLDEALADTHVEPLSEDDADLIHDVTAEEALDEAQRQEDGPAPIVTVSQQFIDDISAKKHTEKTASLVEAEVDRVKEEYPELKKFHDSLSSWQEATKVAKRQAVVSLKSLQGRILTIMDASIGDKEQRAAVKTLINKEFRREITKAGEAETEE